MVKIVHSQHIEELHRLYHAVYPWRSQQWIISPVDGYTTRLADSYQGPSRVIPIGGARLYMMSSPANPIILVFQWLLVVPQTPLGFHQLTGCQAASTQTAQTPTNSFTIQPLLRARSTPLCPWDMCYAEIHWGGLIGDSPYTLGYNERDPMYLSQLTYKPPWVPTKLALRALWQQTIQAIRKSRHT